MLEVPAGAVPPPQQMPADGRVELFFNFGAGARRTTAETGEVCDVLGTSYLLGVRGEGYSFDHFGAPRYIAVRFKPGGFAAFVRLPVMEFTELQMPLDCLWDAVDVRRLEAQLHAVHSPAQQVGILEMALIKRLNAPDQLPRLLYAAEHLQTVEPEGSLLDLAERLNLSQKHFERLFVRYVGVRPSLYARITRFQAAMYHALNQPRSMTLGQLAASAGYYDQAHFSKDFKRFAGISPQAFLTGQHQFVAISTPPQVVDLLQD